MSRGNSNPLYSRGSLASGAVGVPDVADPSKYLYATGQDLMSVGGEYFKAEAAKRKIAEDIAAEKYKIQWEHEYFTELEKQKQQSQEDPYGLADRAYGMGEKSISSFANGISNPKVRDAFNKKAVTSLGSAQTMIRNWASKQTVDNAYSDTEQALATLYQQAGAMTTPEEFGMLRNQGESLINSAVPVIGIEGADKLRKEMNKQMAENFVYAKIDNNPWAVKKYIDSGMFDDIYDEKELHSINDTARQVIKRNETEQKEAAEAAAARKFGIMLDKAANGELKLQEIDQMIRDEKRRKGKGSAERLSQYQYLRDTAVLSGRYPGARLDQTEAIRAVEALFPSGEMQDGKKVKGTKLTASGYYYFPLKNATFEQLQERQRILDYNAGHLTPNLRKRAYDTASAHWDTYLSKNKYHQKDTGKLNYNVYDFNRGLLVLGDYIEDKVPPERRGLTKVKVFEEYSALYEYYLNKAVDPKEANGKSKHDQVVDHFLTFVYNDVLNQGRYIND